MLDEYQKEVALQDWIVEAELEKTDVTDIEACRRITQKAAEVAYGKLKRFKFGYFRATNTSIVYANTSSDDLDFCEKFRQSLALEELDLATAVAPTSGKEQDSTWAVLIDDPDGDYWCEILIQRFFVPRG